MKKIALLLSLSLLLIIASGCVKSTSPSTLDQPFEQPAPKEHNVQIKDFSFTPTDTKIKKGDMVIWTNFDKEEHTVTSDIGNELNSELLEQDETYSHVFRESGTFPYHCEPHPFMKGKIIVE